MVSVRGTPWQQAPSNVLLKGELLSGDDASVAVYHAAPHAGVLSDGGVVAVVESSVRAVVDVIAPLACHPKRSTSSINGISKKMV